MGYPPRPEPLIGNKIFCLSAVSNDLVRHLCAVYAGRLLGSSGHLCSQFWNSAKKIREARVDELGFYAERYGRNVETQPSSGSRPSCFTHGSTGGRIRLPTATRSCLGLMPTSSPMRNSSSGSRANSKASITGGTSTSSCSVIRHHSLRGHTVGRKWKGKLSS